MNDFDTLQEICVNKLKELNLLDYEKRLTEELKEINSQDFSTYFLSIKEKKENENNLLVPYLLGICDEVDLKNDPVFDYGDFPDLDIDMLPEIRDYLMNDYTKKAFGDKYVCNIVTYQTYKLKNTFLDIVRLFDLDRKEALAITSQIKDKDSEGKEMTLDEALEVYDDLRNYFDKYPDVAMAVRKMMSRIKSMGQHASGVIISNVPIDQYVPLVKVPGNDSPCSSWGEGLKTTDLGPVGFVKFDFLALNANMKIALACHLVEQMYGEKVSALPGQGNWSDLSYLNDAKSLEMAKKGDLGMVFQFDASDGIRRLARQCGIESFNDLAAVAALFRPGTMKMNVHEKYCDRKNNKEQFEFHTVTKDFMSTTYDLMIYQEQVMKMLNVVGKIPLKDCEIVRKAISKKKVEYFSKYQEMFVENGQKVLGWEKERLENLWKTIEAFSLYSFNKSHSVAYTYVTARMLYLKANYPLPFYAAVLTCTNDTGDKGFAKLKSYRMEAERHGIRVNRLNVNKSKDIMNIINGEIYWSFDKLKGISKDTAKMISEKQPFVNYEDFLEKVGTDSKILKPLIALGLFEGDPIKLWKYCEYYKKYLKDIQHNEDKIIKYRKEFCGEALDKKLSKYTGKIELIPFDEFEDFKVVIKDDYMELLKDREKAEEWYYGFVWSHQLEKCEKYGHHTVESFISNDMAVGPIDIQVINVVEKKGKVVYYRLEVEDALGTKVAINVWKEDFKQFEEEFVRGKCLRLQVCAPSGGFSTYTLSSFPKFKKRPLKEFDYRVTVL